MIDPEDIFLNVPSQTIPDGLGPMPGVPDTWNPLPNPRTPPPPPPPPPPTPPTVDNEGGSIKIFGIKLFKVTWPKLRPDDPGSGTTEVTQPTIPPPTIPTPTTPIPFKPIVVPDLRPEDPSPVPNPNPSPPDVIISPVPKGKPTGKGR